MKDDDDEDEDYDPSKDSESSEDDKKDLSSDEDEADADLPLHYQVGYGEDPLPPSVASPAQLQAISNKAPLNKSSPGKPSPSLTPDSPSPSSSLGLSSSLNLSTSYTGSPGRSHVTLPTGLRLSRELGILRAQVDLKALFDRLQSLLGITFTDSGRIKFQATLSHLNRSVKPIILPDGSKVEPSPQLRLTKEDVLAYSPRIKQMFLTPFQAAFRLKTLADSTEDFDEREEYLRLAFESYVESLERNTLGEFALHNAARVLQEWLPFFTKANNEQQVISYLAKRFEFLATNQNPALSDFKADIYKTSDLHEARTGRTIKKKAGPAWCHEKIIKRVVLFKEELKEMVADIIASGDVESAETANEVRTVLRECYQAVFQELVPPGSKASKIERKTALQVWKLIEAVINPSQPEAFFALKSQLAKLKPDAAFLTKANWEQAGQLLF